MEFRRVALLSGVRDKYHNCVKTWHSLARWPLKMRSNKNFTSSSNSLSTKLRGPNFHDLLLTAKSRRSFCRIESTSDKGQALTLCLDKHFLLLQLSRTRTGHSRVFVGMINHSCSTPNVKDCYHLTYTSLRLDESDPRTHSVWMSATNGDNTYFWRSK